MDKINDHIDYKSIGDSYFCNIGIYALIYWIESELFYFLNQAFVQCLLHVNVKGVISRKSHMQSCMWNHTLKFTCFPLFVGFT